MRAEDLRPKIYQTLWWMIIVPIIAFWPFVSSFPAFGILEANQFDLKTAINSIFALTGFWPVLCLALAAWYVMGPQAQIEAKRSLPNLRVAISSYVCMWSGLYFLFSISL
jgi:hypothetical protein